VQNVTLFKTTMLDIRYDARTWLFGEFTVGQKVRAAVFPVAGRGTRFLPATKASPKEMLPIVDKPLIQYAVEEAIDAGATKLVFVTGSSKRAIEDHFDTDAELEQALTDSGKDELLKTIRDIVPPGVSCIYIRQGKPLGLGHAVLCARPAVGDEPFFVHLADDLIAGSPGCLTQMAQEHAEHGGSVVAVETVPHESTSSYGIVAVDPANRCRITQIVEKPTPEDAPSDSAVVGRYLLSGSIFDKLQNIGKGAGGEIQLTDGIAALLDESPVYAYSFDGVRYDCGSKLGYLQATVAYGLEHPDTGESLRAHLKGLFSV
jgi:UTP--glucose-1-phosphate uridylyltransferase